ncbi:hypothetical protein ACIBFB_11025 [Nocardiopsis sp. NPDC050513]|uniref:hypothetical protein n=1 Tax=Nocardiopsis sp. NPDC050513 TaxID=3364338 RepID=UPI00379C8374
MNIVPWILAAVGLVLPAVVAWGRFGPYPFAWAARTTALAATGRGRRGAAARGCRDKLSDGDRRWSR